MGGRASHRQRGRVLHRLDRPAAQSAQSVRARRSSTSRMSAAPAAAASSSSCTPAPRQVSMCSARSATPARGSTTARISSGADVSGNALPNTPDYTFTVGAQLSRALTAGDHTLRPRRGHGVRVVPLRRPEPAAQEAYSLANFPRGRARQAGVRRSLDQERVRHPLHSARVPVSGVCAVGLHRRERPAANVRRQRRPHFLGSRVPRSTVRRFFSACARTEPWNRRRWNSETLELRAHGFPAPPRSTRPNMCPPPRPTWSQVPA